MTVSHPIGPSVRPAVEALERSSHDLRSLHIVAGEREIALAEVERMAESIGLELSGFSMATGAIGARAGRMLTEVRLFERSLNRFLRTAEQEK